MDQTAKIVARYRHGIESDTRTLTVEQFLQQMTTELTYGITKDMQAGRERAIMECIAELFTTGKSDSYGWTTFEVVNPV